MSIDLSKIEYIQNHIPTPALYEQLAEECTELAQACLKMSRKLRKENWTPKTIQEIENDITEEYSDVTLVASYILNKPIDNKIMEFKLNRWINRNPPK